MSTEHPDIPSEVPARRAASLSVTHLVSSYDTITPAMAAAAVLGDATKARQVDLFSAGADEAFVEAVLGVADALTALRGESDEQSEPARPVAWAVLDAQGAVISVQQSRTIALDDANWTDGASVAPLVVAGDEVAGEGS